MEFAPMPGAEAFRAEVRAVLDELITDDVIEQINATGTFAAPEVQRALGSRGWLAPTWPKELGGAGRDVYDAAVLAEELNRRDAPMRIITTTMLVANVIRRAGNEQQRALLPKMLAGEVTVALGLTEPDAGSDLASIRTTAVRDGDEWIINGQKMFTSFAHVADYVFLLTLTDPQAPKRKGLTTFLVPLTSPGIEVAPVHTIGAERTNVTFYSDVRVRDEARIGDVDRGWDVMHIALAFERTEMSDATGFGDRLLAHAVRWASESNGSVRPIDDPATRERLASIAIDNAITRLLRLRATWMAAQGELPSVEGSMAKLWGSERFVHATSEVLDLLGTDGLLVRGDQSAPAGGWLELAYREAVVMTIYGGTSEMQRRGIARERLGLRTA